MSNPSARLTAASVRAAWPWPTMASVDDEPNMPGTYCIGGAFLAVIDGDMRDPFPHPLSLSVALKEANALLRDASIDLAVQITLANDAGDFDRAWRLLDEALTFGGEEC